MPVTKSLMVLLCTLLLSSGSEARAEEPADDAQLSQIIDTWKQRAAGVHSAMFALRLRQTYINNSQDMDIAEDDPLVEHLPNGDVAYDYAETVIFDGQRMRYTREGPIFNGSTARFELMKQDNSFDRDKATLFRAPMSSGSYGTATIQQRPERFDWSLLSQAPLTWLLRPFGDELGALHETELRIDREHAAPGLIALVRESAYGGTYLVDPRRDFAIVQFTRRFDDEPPGTRTVVDYRNDTGNVWVPTHWSVAQFDVLGNPLLRIECDVTAFEINADIPPSAFNIPLPSGTVVLDERDRRHRKQYVAAPNGELLPWER